MNNYYDIYCDESDISGQQLFWLGTIVCSPERARILEIKIEEIRNKYEYYSEFKWTKLKGHNCQIYKEFVDIFFDDKYVMFRLMSCEKNYCWNRWEKTTSARMAKTYYCFIGSITSHYNRYYIYADQLFNDYGKQISSIKYLLNKKRKNNWDLKSKNIQYMSEINSSKYNLVQLADVLMGAYKSSGCTNRIKIEMSTYVKEKLDEVHNIKEKRFRIKLWEFKNSQV